jgi:putative flippase GtrA
MSLRAPFAYAVVAGVCLVLHNLVLIGGDLLAAPLWLTVLASFAIVATAGYALHGAFTFRQPLSPLGLGRYALAMSANVPLAYVTTWLWRDVGGLPMPLAAPLASASMIAINFVLSRWAIAPPAKPLADR